MELFEGVLLAVTGVVVPVGGWLVNHMRLQQKDQQDEVNDMEERIGIVEQMFQEYKLHVATNFVAKQDMREMTAGIIDWLRRIDEKLDRKVDKS